MEEAGEREGGLVGSRGDAALLFQLAEHALDAFRLVELAAGVTAEEVAAKTTAAYER